VKGLRALPTVVLVAVVALAALFFFQPLVHFLLFQGEELAVSGRGGDTWLYVYMLRVEIEKLLGEGPPGLWNGAFFYPLHEKSLLYTEPQWGVSLALLPVWLVTRDAFLTLGIAAVGAFVAGWIAAFAFARHLGASRVASVVAAVAFGTSSVFLTLLGRTFFWPFALVVMGLWVTDMLCLSPGRLWIAAFALIFGALAWCSGHLTVMGLVFCAMQAAFCFHAGLASPGAAGRLTVAALSALALIAIPAVPQALALRESGFERTIDAQAMEALNLASFVSGYSSSSGTALARTGFKPAPGEIVVGLPPAALAVATLAFLVALARARTFRKPGRAALAVVIGTLPGLIAGIALPDRIGSAPVNRVATAVVYSTAGALIGLLWPRIVAVSRTPAGWMFSCAVVFALLALGPVVALGDGTAIPSPALLVSRLPGFSAIRASGRWGFLCSFSLAVSAALWISTPRSPRIVLGLAVVVLAAVAADAWKPARNVVLTQTGLRWEPRAVDRALRELKDDGAVLELPVWATQIEAPRMVSRLYHRHPLVNGYGGTIPAFFQDHWAAPAEDLRATGTLTPANVELLRAFGARWWVLHVSELDEKVRDRVPSAFGPVKQVAALDGGMVRIYEDPAPAARR
jgi:hypothetical protein